MTDRLARLRQKMVEDSLDALLITQPYNRFYLSGFAGEDDGPADPAAWLVITKDKFLLITYFVNFERACSEAPLCEPIKIKTGVTISATTAEVLRDLGATRIGFEARYMPTALHEDITGLLGTDKELVSVDGMVEDLRMIKDQEEIRLIAEAARVADDALMTVASSLRPGMTEEAISWAIEKHMREHGAQAVAFETIVASGPNAAQPHCRCTPRPIQAGESIIIDMGARVQGYNSDITRTFVVGEPDARFEEIYGLVLTALEEAEKAIRPGMTGREADDIARQIITQAGYGEAFGHSLGHGVGVAVHEKPHLSRISADVLAENMIVTVEPGVYVPGWGGVRIEDTVVVTANGIVPLTRAPKSYRIDIK